MIPRKLEGKIEKALKAFRGIYIYGPRQSGKTTFVKYLAKKLGYKYLSLDQKQIFETAKSFPETFFKQYRPPLVIDEIQFVPELIPEIKLLLDNSPEKGQLILTGSADYSSSRFVQESLVGRVVGFPLYPFSSAEICQNKSSVLEQLFNQNFDFSIQDIDLNKILQILTTGNFPEVVLTSLSIAQKNHWFENYIKNRIIKDLDIIASIYGKEKLFSLLNRLAWQSSNLINFSNLSSENLTRQTARHYFNLLKALYLVELLRPYEKNFAKRFVKMPKIFFTDTGILSFLLNANSHNLINNPNLAGKIFENYIFTELRKEISFALQSYNLFFFRDNKKNEVDFVIENSLGEIIALEVKAKTNLKDDDFKGLKMFKNRFPELKFSYLVYLGNTFQKINLKNFQIIILPAKMFLCMFDKITR